MNSIIDSAGAVEKMHPPQVRTSPGNVAKASRALAACLGFYSKPKRSGAVRAP